MQIILQGMMVLLWLIFVPMLLGTAIEVWCQKEIQYRSAYLLGTFFMWAVFQLIAVLAIEKKVTLTYVMYGWIGIIFIGIVADLFYLSKHLGIIRTSFKQLKTIISTVKEQKIFLLYVFVVLIVGMELIIYFFGMHIDQDDSRFVTNSVIAWNRDTMLLANPQTGAIWDRPYGEAVKDAVAPWSIFIAMLSRLLFIHPTIVTHTVLPGFLLVMCYFAYSLLIGEMLRERKRDIIICMLLFCVFLLFGRLSIYTGATFILTRIWQGKAVVVAVMLPYILFWLMKLYDDCLNLKRYVVLMLIHIAGCLLSGMGITLCAILSGAQIGSYGLQKKKWQIWIYGGIACIPNLIYALLYMRG